MCGKPTSFISFNEGYRKFCSTKCSSINEEVVEKKKETCLKNNGVEFPGQSAEIRKKQLDTKIEKYGNGCNYEKYQQTCLERYGVDNYFKMPDFNHWHPEKYEKVSKTLTGKKHPGVDVNMKQRISTCLEKYGVEHYVQSEEYKERQKSITDKIFNTKIKNGSTNTSKDEHEIYDMLCREYSEVEREYKSELYPYRCDFYLVKYDLYIEYQGYFTHGFKAYFENNDDEILKKWYDRADRSDFYKNAINIWTNLDVKKRETAFNNKIKYLEIFDNEDIITQVNRVLNGLQLNYTDEKIQNEYMSIYKQKSTLDKAPTHNKAVLKFQKHFYEHENFIYQNNPILRRKLIQNRIKYLNKKEHELTDRELLSGFKITGIHNSYSFFSPHWFKYFIESNNIKTVYDPFGGWGHRLLGAKNLDLYVYNDISLKTTEGVKKLADYFGINNVKFYNEDSSYFIPTENCEALFMCPPYYNIEKYENRIDDFESLMRNVLKYKCKYYGIIIKENFENLLVSILGKYDKKEILNYKKSHFGKKINEFLYTWTKN